MEQEKINQLLNEYNANKVDYINARLVALIKQLEDAGRADEMVYIKALELLKD